MTAEQQEMRLERAAICTAEGVSEADIERIFKSRLDLYGIEAEQWKQESL